MEKALKYDFYDVNRSSKISRAEFEEGVPARWIKVSAKKQDVKDFGNPETIKDDLKIDLLTLSARRGYIVDESSIEFMETKDEVIAYGIAYDSGNNNPNDTLKII